MAVNNQHALALPPGRNCAWVLAERAPNAPVLASLTFGGAAIAPVDAEINGGAWILQPLNRTGTEWSIAPAGGSSPGQLHLSMRSIELQTGSGARFRFRPATPRPRLVCEDSNGETVATFVIATLSRSQVDSINIEDRNLPPDDLASVILAGSFLALRKSPARTGETWRSFLAGIGLILLGSVLSLVLQSPWFAAGGVGLSLLQWRWKAKQRKRSVTFELIAG